MLPTKFRFIWESRFREEDFQKSTNQKKELLVATMFLNRSGPNEQYRGPSINASYQVMVQLAKRFIGEYFQKWTNQKQELTVAAMFINESERNEQSLQRTAHRYFLLGFGSFGPAVSEKKIFKKSARDKNLLWRPCVLTDRDEMSNRYREPSINASYQVSVHLDKRFQRRIFLEIDQSEARIDCGGQVC